LALRTTTRPTWALLTARSALALRSLVLLLSTRPRTPRAFCPRRPSRVSAAALDAARLLRLGLRPRLLSRLLPHLWAARLSIGTLLARS
jgi:hypothetical protein